MRYPFTFIIMTKILKKNSGKDSENSDHLHSGGKKVEYYKHLRQCLAGPLRLTCSCHMASSLNYKSKKNL